MEEDSKGRLRGIATVGSKAVQRKTRKAEPAVDGNRAADLSKRYFSYQSFAFRSGFFEKKAQPNRTAALVRDNFSQE